MYDKVSVAIMAAALIACLGMIAHSLNEIVKALKGDGIRPNVLSRLYSIDEKMDALKRDASITQAKMTVVADFLQRHEGDVKAAILITELSARLGVPLPGNDKDDGPN